jgi:RNA polymerase sigma-70 factor (ECF subfamily)
MAILSEDVAFVSDGGAGIQALRRPIVGSDPVSRLLLHGAPRERAAFTAVRLVSVNGRLGFLAYRGATPRAAVAFDTDGELIRAIYLIANPAKLRRLPGSRSQSANRSFDQY